MAEDSLVQLLQNQQAPEQEIVETWPGYSPEGKDGLSSLLGRKAGDVIQKIRETFDPGIPEEAFPATTRKELERKEAEDMKRQQEDPVGFQMEKQLEEDLDDFEDIIYRQ